ncbi:alpha-L-fucosidase [Pseudoflavitalea sp. G-6-1-2]|uniref:alpha-L-fucosidase n=1 Tax=Pseudoflavitalea sp. G-6-1-2 TaxID=2728841 RepID=UPI00146A3EF5|nr:alpha-L-fucosidase [Pseudoflavitalea sp. G-6-1-2]NML22203.1 alpha-L-fucosidase [Pseudoflavitalea sp. G-6-1-2]
MRKSIIYTTALISSLIWADLKAQSKGDEDTDLVIRAKMRDKQAIDEAKNGWWTASQRNLNERIAWWQDARFGMFVHWGIYSLPGGEWKGQKVSGYAEHLMRKEKISRAEYLELAHQFNPEKFNAEEWIRQAQQAGMKYFIITSKHHDGFAMFDSKVSDFNIIQQSPFKRDPMAELAAACKKLGMKFGFYYSHAFDWEHPDAPGNDWEYNNPGGDKQLHGGVNWFDVHPELLPKAQKYVDEKAIPQIKELLNKYHPDILWFDTPSKLPLSENIRILKAIRETDPAVVVNGRLVRGSGAELGDYKNTADRPAEFFPVTGNWEAIPTTNESYGYSKYDLSHKPVSHFIRLMANAASRGGNLLMNIGPKGDGTIDTRDQQILQGIGKWMKTNGASIYGSSGTALPKQNWGVITEKKNTIFLHVFDWPADKKVKLGGVNVKVSKAYFLADPTKRALPVQQLKDVLQVTVPVNAPDSVNTVIVLETTGKATADSVMYLAPDVKLTRLLAFDGKLEGKGWKYGDGKTDKFYVEGWKDADQSVSWQFKTTEKASYKIKIRYIAGGGNYVVTMDKSLFEKPVSTGKGVVSEEVGTIIAHPGWHEMRIRAKDVQRAELMKLLEIQLEKIVPGK